MTGFINSLINRATASPVIIQPRVRGMYEQPAADPFITADSDEPAAFTHHVPGAETPDARHTEMQQPRPGLQAEDQQTSPQLHTIPSSLNPRRETVSAHSLLNSTARSDHHTDHIKNNVADPEADHAVRNHQQEQQPTTRQRRLVDHQLILQSFNSTTPLPVNEPAETTSSVAREISELKTKQSVTSQQVIKEEFIKDKTGTTSALPLVLPQPVHQQEAADEKEGYSMPRGQASLQEQLLKSTNPLTREFALEKEASQAIHVSIGRIEVRLVQPPATAPAPSKRVAIKPMSLDEYLQKK